MKAKPKVLGDPEVRAKILSTAARLFHTHGYHATGINELIAEAGVAKRSLYKHFESKTDILKAYLETYQEQLYQDITEYLQKFSDPRERLLALFDFRIRNQIRIGYLGCPFAKINAEAGYDDREINKLAQASQSKLKAGIGRLVSAANSKKQLSDEELSSLVFLLMEGGLLSAAIEKNTIQLQKAKALVHGLLF